MMQLLSKGCAHNRARVFRIGASFAALLAWGCTSAELRGAPDAAGSDQEIGVVATGDCPDSAVPLCDAAGADPASGCRGEPERGDAASAQIPASVVVPLGCVVNVPATYRTPQGECLVAYACRCVNPDARASDAGASQWDCVR